MSCHRPRSTFTWTKSQLSRQVTLGSTVAFRPKHSSRPFSRVVSGLSATRQLLVGKQFIAGQSSNAKRQIIGSQVRAPVAAYFWNKWQHSFITSSCFLRRRTRYARARNNLPLICYSPLCRVRRANSSRAEWLVIRARWLTASNRSSVELL